MPVTIQGFSRGADVSMILPPDGVSRDRPETVGEREDEPSQSEAAGDEPKLLPARVAEARTIVAICTRRLSPPCLQALAVELDDAVGSKTDNEALRLTLKMLRTTAARLCLSSQGQAGRPADACRLDRDAPPNAAEVVVAAAAPSSLVNTGRRLGWYAAFCAIVILHCAVVAGVTASFLVLPFRAPSYIALPLCVLIFNLLLTPVDCPLTRLENLCRRAMGWPEIRGFVKYYLVGPLRERRKHWRPRSAATTS